MRSLKDVHEQVRKRRCQRFQPYDWAWSSRNEVHDKWTKATSTFFKDLKCCAICGVTKLLHKNKKYKSIPNPNINDFDTLIQPGCTPYGIANVCLSQYTTNATGNVMHLCMKCYMNKTKPVNARYVIYQSPSYTKSIISTNPLHVQLLSFLDIGLHIQSRNWGFSTGQILETSLLNSPLLSWDGTTDKTATIEELSSTVGPILAQNMQSNPLFKKYLTVFEQPHKNTSMCILTPEIISHIIQPNNTPTTFFPTMSVPSAVYDLTILFDMRDTAQHNKHNDFFVIGDIHRREASENGIPSESIAFRSDTMNIEKYGLTLETALFPFLFPHGHGAYDGKTTFFEYLKYRMETLFSPFTLYKPYLLYMYDVRQSLQLLKETSKTCLEKEIKQIKHQYPHMTEQDVLQHITKYNLPSSIQGTPRWHKSQLQDLLAMVEKFGMPHFFLTLTADETSSLRWKEVTNIEEIAKTIDPSLS